MQLGAPTYKVAWFFNHVILWGHITNLTFYIFTYTRPLATKYGKMVTYREGHPLINVHSPLNMKPHKVMWQIKNIISNAFGHETCQDGGIPQGASTHKFT